MCILFWCHEHVNLNEDLKELCCIHLKDFVIHYAGILGSGWKNYTFEKNSMRSSWWWEGKIILVCLFVCLFVDQKKSNHHPKQKGWRRFLWIWEKYISKYFENATCFNKKPFWRVKMTRQNDPKNGTKNSYSLLFPVVPVSVTCWRSVEDGQKERWRRRGPQEQETQQ